MLTDHEVEHIATLARLALSPELKDRMKKDLSSILEYVEHLEAVDTSGAAPLYQVTGLQNTARPDEHRGDWPMDETLTGLLIESAPHHEGRFIKTKTVKSK